MLLQLTHLIMLNAFLLFGQLLMLIAHSSEKQLSLRTFPGQARQVGLWALHLCQPLLGELVLTDQVRAALSVSVV